MNRYIYTIIVLLVCVSGMAIASDYRQALALLAESKKEFRVKEVEGIFVTPRSVERTRHLLLEKQLPVSAVSSLQEKSLVMHEPKKELKTEQESIFFDEMNEIHSSCVKSLLTKNQPSNLSQVLIDTRCPLLDTMPEKPVKQLKKPNYELSRAPQKQQVISRVTTRKKINSTSPQILLDASARFEAKNAKLEFKRARAMSLDTPVAYKFQFDNYLKHEQTEKIIEFLLHNKWFRKSYPLASKLYAVMTNQTDELVIHPGELAIIPLPALCAIAKSLAVFGGNEQFLEKYARFMHEDKQLRKIIESDC